MNESLKIMVSGDEHYGLGQSLKRKFPDAVFASRKSGFDLSHIEERRRFARQCSQADVYISCSSLHDFLQVQLLREVAKTWMDEKKAGYIIALGSSADTPVKGSKWIYPIEKKALRSYCRNLSQLVLGGHGGRPAKVRVTYLSPGYLDTPKEQDKNPHLRKISTDYVAELIDWLISQPPEYNISELCLDPIQNED